MNASRVVREGKSCRAGVPAPRDLGLVVEYEPNDKDPEVDIIAVHGLGARWPWRRIVESPSGKKACANWLADDDMLPCQVHEARILTFNYDSCWHSKAPQQTLVDCGNELYHAIYRDRAQNPESQGRPIVFIGHSLGGILVEQAIVLAGGSQKEDFDLMALIAGLVFLGTPFRGSGLANTGAIIASAACCLGLVSETRIIRTLKPSSEILDGLTQSFASWLRRCQVPCFFFHEKLRTSYRYMGISLSDLVVPKDSACIYGFEMEGLYANHLSIAKYDNSKDPNYIKVSREIVRMATKALSVVQRRRRVANAGYIRRMTPEEMSHMFEIEAAVRCYRNCLPAQVLFQQPVIFEDAHGFKWPIHTDFITSWRAFEYVLTDNFQARGVKGVAMVQAGNYSLTNLRTRRDSTREADFASVFRSGVKVNMSMLFKRLSSEMPLCPACQVLCPGSSTEIVSCSSCGLVYSWKKELENGHDEQMKHSGLADVRSSFNSIDSDPKYGTAYSSENPTPSGMAPVLDAPGDFARVMMIIDPSHKVAPFSGNTQKNCSQDPAAVHNHSEQSCPMGDSLGRNILSLGLFNDNSGASSFNMPFTTLSNNDWLFDTDTTSLEDSSSNSLEIGGLMNASQHTPPAQVEALHGYHYYF